MKHATVTVPWREGMHLRHSAKVVQSANGFTSTIRLKLGGKIADARSILSVLTLAAAMGAALEIEASGQDEQSAVDSVSGIFMSDIDGNRIGDAREGNHEESATNVPLK